MQSVRICWSTTAGSSSTWVSGRRVTVTPGMARWRDRGSSRSPWAWWMAPSTSTARRSAGQSKSTMPPGMTCCRRSPKLATSSRRSPSASAAFADVGDRRNAQDWSSFSGRPPRAAVRLVSSRGSTPHVVFPRTHPSEESTSADSQGPPNSQWPHKQKDLAPKHPSVQEPIESSRGTTPLPPPRGKGAGG